MQIVAWRRCGGWTCSFPVSVGTREKHTFVFWLHSHSYLQMQIKEQQGVRGERLGLQILHPNWKFVEIFIKLRYAKLIP